MNCMTKPDFQIERPNTGRIEVRVARGLDDMMMAFAIRSAVFLAEQSCPYHEEFDGNDMTATHVLGFVDDEPAATMRIRYFGTFAKMERLAVRREFRIGRVGPRVIDYTLEFLRRKGYHLACGHAQEGRERFWQFATRKFGKATPIPGAERFAFSGHSYTAVAVEMEADPEALRVDTDPLIMNRPEGEWDRPGVLELSMGKLPQPVGRLRA